MKSVEEKANRMSDKWSDLVDDNLGIYFRYSELQKALQRGIPLATAVESTNRTLDRLEEALNYLHGKYGKRFIDRISMGRPINFIALRWNYPTSQRVWQAALYNPAKKAWDYGFPEKRPKDGENVFVTGQVSHWRNATIQTVLPCERGCNLIYLNIVWWVKPTLPLYGDIVNLLAKW